MSSSQYLHFIYLKLIEVQYTCSPKVLCMDSQMMWDNWVTSMCPINNKWLSAKRCANGGSDFWLSIKSVSNTLSCCCFVCASIIGQYHSGNNMSSKSGAAGDIIFWKWKAPQNLTPKNRQAHSEYFWRFHSHTWWIKTLPQSPICTEEISLYTMHIKSIITKFCFWS